MRSTPVGARINDDDEQLRFGNGSVFADLAQIPYLSFTTERLWFMHQYPPDWLQTVLAFNEKAEITVERDGNGIPL